MTATATETAMETERGVTMRAVVREHFGPPDVLELREVARPELADDSVLVRVRAASLNKVDWYDVTGRPLVARPLTGLRGPKDRLVGRDLAGVVEQVGSAVTGLEPGDDVYGTAPGSLAEVAACAGSKVARMPAGLTYEEAAAVPVAAVTALQGLRDHGRLRPGQSVLVHGAAGGVGTFAVQIAKALGAEVTAVCSTRNVEQAWALGADHVVDYTREDVTRGGRDYDLILEVNGARRWSAYRRVLRPHGALVMVGGKGTALTGPLGHVLRVLLAAAPGSRRAAFYMARIDREVLDTLRELIESGAVRPVVERRYALSEAADALRRLGEGHAQGKIVIGV